MANPYLDTAPRAPDTLPLDADTRADIAVVGGGITGLSTALHAAEAGASVVLLEAEEPGFGASGRNGGQVNPGLKLDPDTVEGAFGADLGGRMNALAGNAPKFLFDLIKRHAIHCEARQNGTLCAAVTAKQAAAVRATAEQLVRRGAPVEVLERPAVTRSTGTDRYTAAMLDKRGGDLNPLSLSRGLACAAIGAGARIHYPTRVARIARADGAWRLSTDRACVRAAHLVIATNGYTDGIWPQLRGSIVPLFGAIAATERLSDAVCRAIMPSRSVLYERGAITVYHRLDSQQRLLIGGRGPMREIAAPAAVPHLTRYARKLWPELAGVDWTHGWAGRLAMTRDHYPHVHEPAAGVLICLGYNGRGVAMAAAMGAQLARRITDPAAPFDMPITTLRSIPLQPLWPIAVKAAIAHGRIAEWLGL